MITIVSGLPRSGTSLMMQMLAAGGMHILTDNIRSADEDNPRGYCEWEPTKHLSENPELITHAEGKAVKVVSELLFTLPPKHDYKIIFMERPLKEILASQDVMLGRRGKSNSADNREIIRAFEEHLKRVTELLIERDNFSSCRIGYRKLIQDPWNYVEQIGEFLGLSLNTVAMTQQVDLSLYRNR